MSNTSLNPIPLACPFCGNTPSCSRDVTSGLTHDAPWLWGCINANCPARVIHASIETWNRRASTPDREQQPAATSGFMQLHPARATLEWSDQQPVGLSFKLGQAYEAINSAQNSLNEGDLGGWELALVMRHIEEAMQIPERESAAPLKATIRSLSGAIDRLHDIVRGESLEHDASEIATIINRAQDEARAALGDDEATDGSDND